MGCLYGARSFPGPSFFRPGLFRVPASRGPALSRVAHEGEEAIEAVDELAVRQGEEQREHDAEMDGEKHPHRRGVAQHEQRKAGEAREEQHRDEGGVHS
jgi:hypothetical protein